MSRLNWRKPHEIHGAGPGFDIVIQDGKLYDRSGKSLPSNLAEVHAQGIPVPDEVRLHLSTAKARREANDRKRLLDDYVEKVRREAVRKLEAGELFEGEGDEEAILDGITGLEELERELSSNVATKSRVKKRK
jgi:hypothetical protein